MSVFGTLLHKIMEVAAAHQEPGHQEPAQQPAPAQAQTAAATPTAMPGARLDDSDASNGRTAPEIVAAGQKSSSPEASAQPTPQPVDVSAVLDSLTKKHPEKLNWKTSIVDLLKLVGMDSSLAARKELARELEYSGGMSDSAEMNVWLHKAVMKRLSETGGKVPPELLPGASGQGGVAGGAARSGEAAAANGER